VTKSDGLPQRPAATQAEAGRFPLQGLRRRGGEKEAPLSAEEDQETEIIAHRKQTVYLTIVFAVIYIGPRVRAFLGIKTPSVCSNEH
jgi:hypothetical protein